MTRLHLPVTSDLYQSITDQSTNSASTLLLAVIFVIPCAVAKNLATLLVCRAIDGIAFSAPMTLVGGTLADLWKNEERGVPMAAFSAAPFLGPARKQFSPFLACRESRS